MPFLELCRIAAELVPRLGPRIVGAGLLENVPGLLNLRVAADRLQLQGPEDDLAEVADELDRVGI